MRSFTFLVPKHGYHYIVSNVDPKFLPWWRVRMIPLSRLYFDSRIEKRNSCLFHLDNWWNKSTVITCSNCVWHIAAHENLCSSFCISGSHVQETSALSGRHAQYFYTDFTEMLTVQAFFFHGQLYFLPNHLFHWQNHVARPISTWPRNLLCVFTWRSTLFEL